MKKLSKKKTIVIIALCALGITALCVADYILGVVSYQNKVRNTIITEVDLSEISDGTYIGEYDVDYIYAKVEVTVKSGEVVAVTILEHRHDRGESAERIAGDIVAEQKINVDGITGVTNSSTVIKKAVENALNYEKLEDKSGE
jgi:uncharacterized protein with FMN-binding domain